MDITQKTTVREAAAFLKKEHIEELMDKVDPYTPKKPVFEMTVGEFIEALDEDYAKVFFDDPDEYLVIAVGRLKAFKRDIENVQKILALNEIKLDADEVQAQAGIVFPTVGENMLVECVEWFHLHSIREAEDVKLTDWLLMKKSKNAGQKYERNLMKVHEAKAKQRR